MELPMLIKRCLVHQIKILPYQLNGVLKQYELKKVPDSVLANFSQDQLDLYVKGLYKSSCESAGDWTEGHSKLKELGFVQHERKDGHRCFISLKWPEVDEG